MFRKFHSDVVYSKLYGVNATMIIFVFVLYCIVVDNIDCSFLMSIHSEEILSLLEFPLIFSFFF